MKKFLISLIIFCISIGNTVFATPQFTYYDEVKSDESLLIDTGIGPNVSNIDGEEYTIDASGFLYSQKYIPGLYKKIGIGQYVWTGEYYFIRSSSMDGVWDYDFIQPVWFYDKDYNLVYEHYFGRYGHVKDIGYKDGTYYCEITRDLEPPYYDMLDDYVVKSTDMVNWEKTEEEVPKMAGSLVYTKTDKVALDGKNLKQVTYEGDVTKKLCTTFGEWFVKKGNDKNFYFSNDNVYFVKVEYPSELRAFDEEYGYGYEFKTVYEYQNQIVIELYRDNYYKENHTSDFNPYPHMYKKVRLFVPTEEVYAALDEQKAKAEYVTLNGELLGFEEMPVREDDRLLVPMRFLFEKMGAEVEWDQATQTATVLQENDAVAFQINNRSATVNSQAQTMDVPARLINDKTMIPIRFLSENLGYTVEWDEETNMAIITK